MRDLRRGWEVDVVVEEGQVGVEGVEDLEEGEVEGDGAEEVQEGEDPQGIKKNYC